eukprot:TRINITY_DN7969_c0_g1_i1.p1 TRINITY_DN7969_c0_g1~~TRINITY_DN7969_c0_g1_i1.p1  ORF type:complete len:1856 (+),score=363.73 TRINITY_DN7969_c0_g1_i1:393-5570(+)
MNEAAVEAKGYLDKHKVGKFLQTMVQELLQEQPEDPFSFMGAYITGAGVKPACKDESSPPPLPARRRSSDRRSSEADVGFPASGGAPLPDLSGHHSIVARILHADPGLYTRLQDVRTPLGVSLARCIKPGIDVRGHHMIRSSGLVAGDAECYNVFEDVFLPVMRDLHGAVGMSPAAVQLQDIDASKVRRGPVDALRNFVLSVQVVGRRNLQGLRMPPAISREERREAERVVVGACLGFDGSLSGDYHPLRGSDSFVPVPGGMSEVDEARFEAEGLSMEMPDSLVMLAAGFGQQWPEGRGIFVSEKQNVAIFLNELDHFRIVSKENGSDLHAAFKRFFAVEAFMREGLSDAGYEVACCRRFGYLTANPECIGTALTISANVVLPRLGAQPQFSEFCKKIGLGARIPSYASEAPVEGVWEIFSGVKLGQSEVEQANRLTEGCLRLIQLERALENGESLDLPAQPSAMRTTTDEFLVGDEHPGFPVSDCPETLPDLNGLCSLCADVLREDPTIYERLRTRRTPSGVSFAACVKPCFDNEGHPMIKTIGAVAGDDACYSAFGELFDPIIARRHHLRVGSKAHPTDWDCARVVDLPLDPSDRNDRVISVRIRVSRSIRGLRMAPVCTLEERREVERIVTEALGGLGNGLSGEYWPLCGSQSYPLMPQGMSAEKEEEFVSKGLVFQVPDSGVLLAAGVGRHWPDARGTFVGDMQNFMVWVNPEEHVHMEYTLDGADLTKAFEATYRLHDALEAGLAISGHTFARSERLGYLGCCPSNLGTCLTASVTLRLPLLGSLHEFREICSFLKLNAHLSTFDPSSGLWQVSNMERLGSSEVSQVNSVIEGCRRLLEFETKLEHGEHPSPELWQRDLVDINELRQTTRDGLVQASLTGNLSMLFGALRQAEEDENVEVPLPALPCRFDEMPGLGSEPVPGFPVDDCPASLPDISKLNSITAKVLRKDPSIYTRLQNLRTPGGVSLARCIKPAMDNMGHKMIRTVGLVAGDADCYDTFNLIFDEVIRLRHPESCPEAVFTSDVDVSKVSRARLDPEARRVVGAQIELSRNLRGFRMLAAIERVDRMEVERVLVKALLGQSDESTSPRFGGEYWPLSGSESYLLRPGGMNEAAEKQLNQRGLLFHHPDSSQMLSGGIGRHWPEARGVFSNAKGDLSAWINEEDHLRLILKVNNGEVNLAKAFSIMRAAEDSIRAAVQAEGYDWARSRQYGYLTSCPSNVGTAMRVAVKVVLPLLGEHSDFRKVCKRLQLQARRFDGDQNRLETWELRSDSQPWGQSEVDQVNAVIEGSRALVKAEEQLTRGEQVDLESINREPLLTTAEAIPGLGDVSPQGFPTDVCPVALPDLSAHCNMTARLLREQPELYERLRGLRTPLGVGLALCIKPGMDVQGHVMVRTLGLVAGDPACYDVFRDLFDPVLKSCTTGSSADSASAGRMATGTLQRQPSCMDPFLVDAEPLDPSGQHLVSSRFRASRNLAGLRFAPTISRDERREVERVVVEALSGLCGDLEGEYFPLEFSSSTVGHPQGVDEDMEAELEDCEILLKPPESILSLASGVGRHWPDARGVFVNESRSLAVWVNGHEEHMDFVVTTPGTRGLREAFERFCRISEATRQAIRQQGHDFAYSDQYGYLTADPADVGTGGLRVTLLMRIVQLEISELKATCKAFGVCPRPRDSKQHGRVWSIEATGRLGQSEVDVINRAAAACRKLVELETKAGASSLPAT